MLIRYYRLVLAIFIMTGVIESNAEDLQRTETITGTVINNVTRELVAGANVIIPDTIKLYRHFTVNRY